MESWDVWQVEGQVDHEFLQNNFVVVTLPFLFESPESNFVDDNPPPPSGSVNYYFESRQVNLSNYHTAPLGVANSDLYLVLCWAPIVLILC